MTETLFNYPGIGKLVLDSAIGHDLPVLQATVLLTALMYMILALIADVLYTWLIRASASPVSGRDRARRYAHGAQGGRRCDRR